VNRATARNRRYCVTVRAINRIESSFPSSLLFPEDPQESSRWDGQPLPLPSLPPLVFTRFRIIPSAVGIIAICGRINPPALALSDQRIMSRLVIRSTIYPRCFVARSLVINCDSLSHLAVQLPRDLEPNVSTGATIRIAINRRHRARVAIVY